MELSKLIQAYAVTPPLNRQWRAELVLTHPDVERLLYHIAAAATETERGWLIDRADLDRAIRATSQDYAEALRHIVGRMLYLQPAGDERVKIDADEVVPLRVRLLTLTQAERMGALMLGAEGLVDTKDKK